MLLRQKRDVVFDFFFARTAEGSLVCWISTLRWRAVFVALQYAAALPIVTPNINFPPQFSRMLGFLRILAIRVPGDCLNTSRRYTYYHTLIAATLGPVLVTALVVLIGTVFHLMKRVTRQAHATSYSIWDIATRCWVLITYILHRLSAEIKLRGRSSSNFKVRKSRT